MLARVDEVALASTAFRRFASLRVCSAESRADAQVDDTEAALALPILIADLHGAQGCRVQGYLAYVLCLVSHAQAENEPSASSLRFTSPYVPCSRTLMR